VYASNYPPVGRFITEADISFTGTPLYDLIVEYEGNTLTLPAGSTYQLPAGYSLSSFHDNTGAPGIIISHAVYCLYEPGVVGGTDIFDTDLSCASYTAGAIGGAGDTAPGCASYAPGAIGGAGSVAPS
jgi:hypothetical protein